MPIRNDSRQDLLALLALCPLLGASRSLSTAIGLCIAMTVCLIVTNLMQRALARVTAPALVAPTAVLIWTSLVIAMNLYLQAFWPQLQRALGIYLPLLVGVALLRFHLVRDVSAAVPFREWMVFCVATLALGVLRQWLGGITALALLPPGGLILAGLLLAARNKISAIRKYGVA